MAATVSDAKLEYGEKLNRLLDEYSKVLFCDIDNVRSQQMHGIRKSLRGRGEMLMGKKTMQKKIIGMRAEGDSASETDKALSEKLVTENMLVGNLALIFTNEDVSEIEKLLQAHRIQAPARVGAISPVEVVIPAGNTGLEPTTTNFFQALSIATKIAKGCVEITADKKVLSVGDKVDNSTAVLLQKLKIFPFFYAAEVRFYFERGLMFTAEDMKVTDDAIEAEFMKSISNLTAVSLATGILTEASFPHAVTDGFKNLLAAAVASEYTFDEFNGAELIQAIKEGKIGGGAAAPAAAAAAPAAAAAAAPAAADESSEDIEEMDLF